MVYAKYMDGTTFRSRFNFQFSWDWCFLIVVSIYSEMCYGVSI